MNNCISLKGKGAESGFSRNCGRARSLEIKTSQGLGIGLIVSKNNEMEEESQLRFDGARAKQLKVLAAKKELVTQSEAGVSHSMMEGGILDKLVDMEDKAVGFKAIKEGVRLS